MRAELDEDLAAWRAEGGEPSKSRASEATRRAERERLTGLGAIPLNDAADARDIDRDTLRRWAPDSKSAFRGPRGTWWFRNDDDLDRELESFHCQWTAGCERYALLSASGRCKLHDACVERDDGWVTATHFAEKHRIYPPDLLARIKANEIPAENVDRNGRPGGWLLHEQRTLAVLDEKFRCQWHAGCARYALARSRHCNQHHAAASAIANARGKITVICSQCGDVYENYPSQITRKGDLCRQCNLASEEFDRKRRNAVREVWDRRYEQVRTQEGVAHRRRLAEQFGLASSGPLAADLRARGVPETRLEAHGIEFALLDIEAAHRARLDQFRQADGRLRAWLSPIQAEARLRARGIVVTGDDLAAALDRLRRRQGWFGLLASERAARQGKRVGRPIGMSPEEEHRIIQYSADGKSQRFIARRVGVSRGLVSRVLRRNKKVARNPG